MPLKIARDVLIADPTVYAAVGERISPVQAQPNDPFPRIVLTSAGLDPINSLSGWAGLDRNEVEMQVWATDYTGAKTIADAGRVAMNAAGHITIGEVSNHFNFELDLSAFLVGYIFRIWK